MHRRYKVKYPLPEQMRLIFLKDIHFNNKRNLSSKGNYAVIYMLQNVADSCRMV